MYRKGRDESRASCGAIYIDTPQGRKRAGQLECIGGELVFVRHVIRSRHLHRKLDAWGIDEALLRHFLVWGVTTIRIVSDTGSMEVATVRQYCLKGLVRDFGHNRQVFLPRRCFRSVFGDRETSQSNEP